VCYQKHFSALHRYLLNLKSKNLFFDPTKSNWVYREIDRLVEVTLKYTGSKCPTDHKRFFVEPASSVVCKSAGWRVQPGAEFYHKLFWSYLRVLKKIMAGKAMACLWFYWISTIASKMIDAKLYNHQCIWKLVSKFNCLIIKLMRHHCM
jgi:hypothetical protein